MEKAAHVQLQSSLFYLMSLTLPYVDDSVAQYKFEPISVRIFAFLENETSSAAQSQQQQQRASPGLMKCVLSSMENTLCVQDSESWSAPMQVGERVPEATVRIVARYIFRLATDNAPKIRKRANQTVSKLFSHIPASPSILHPLSFPLAQACVVSIRELEAAAKNGIKDNRRLRILQLIRLMVRAGQWPDEQIKPLIEALLPNTHERNDTYVRVEALDIYRSIFERVLEKRGAEDLHEMLSKLLESMPETSNEQIVPSWLAVISGGYASIAERDNGVAGKAMLSIYTKVIPLFETDSVVIREAAAGSLLELNQEILSLDSVEMSDIEQIAKLVKNAFTVRYRISFPEICKIQASLIDRLPMLHESLFKDVVDLLMNIRSGDAFEGSANVDLVIGGSIRIMGPRKFLARYPLNLESHDKAHPGRAWLLPLLRQNIQSTELSHFVEEFVPLCSRLYELIEKQDVNEKTAANRIKVYETLIHQVWDLFQGYCVLPIDLPKVWTNDFLEMISNVLYRQINLRGPILRALSNLIQSNRDVAQGKQKSAVISVDQATENLKLIENSCSNILAVLFNVFSQSAPSSRTDLNTCINRFLDITPDNVCSHT